MERDRDRGALIGADFEELDREKVATLMDRFKGLVRESRTGEILVAFESLSKSLIEAQQELSFAKSNAGSEYVDQLQGKIKQLKLYVDGQLNYLREDHEQKLIRLQQAFRTELSNAMAIRDEDCKRRIVAIEENTQEEMQIRGEKNAKVINDLTTAITHREEMISDLQGFIRTSETKVQKYHNEMANAERLMTESLAAFKSRDSQVTELISRMKLAITQKDAAISALQSSIHQALNPTQRESATVGPPVLDRAEYNSTKESYDQQLLRIQEENEALEKKLAAVEQKIKKQQYLQNKSKLKRGESGHLSPGRVLQGYNILPFSS